MRPASLLLTIVLLLAACLGPGTSNPAEADFGVSILLGGTGLWVRAGSGMPNVEVTG